MFLTIILFITILLCLLIYYVLAKDMNYWKKRNVPGPKPTLYFGNIKESALRRENIAFVVKKIYDAYPNEKVVGMFRMKTPCLLIRDPELIKNIMIKDFDNFADRGVEFSKEGLGSNLFHADGETWRILRNRFTPIFTSGKLKNMLYLIEQRGDLFIKHYNEIIRLNPEQDIKKLIQKFTISSIAATGFGLDIDFDDNRMFKKLDVIDKLLFTTNFSEDLDMMFPGILKVFGGSLLPKYLIELFSNMVQTVIKERNGMPTNRNDFMDLMLGMRQEGILKKKTETDELSLEMTESVMMAQAFVFYGAGYETSATTMSFMMYQLALNPDVQERLIAHIDEVLARHGGKTTYECLSELTYMDRVFDETLRMYPIVDPLLRCAVNDYKIPGMDLVIRKGQTILISPRALQHDLKYYDNPGKFDPERFSPENSGKRHSGAYLPFGIGPRNCIGARFARVQSKVIITKFLSKYRVEVAKGTQIPIKYGTDTRVVGPLEGSMILKIVPRS